MNGDREIWQPVTGMFVAYALHGLLTTGRAPPGELSGAVSLRAHDLRPAQRWDAPRQNRLRSPSSAIAPRGYPNHDRPEMAIRRPPP